MFDWNQQGTERPDPLRDVLNRNVPQAIRNGFTGDQGEAPRIIGLDDLLNLLENITGPYAQAEPGEYWCQECKCGHLVGTYCPRSNVPFDQHDDASRPYLTAQALIVLDMALRTVACSIMTTMGLSAGDADLERVGRDGTTAAMDKLVVTLSLPEGPTQLSVQDLLFRLQGMGESLITLRQRMESGESLGLFPQMVRESEGE